MYYGYSIYLNSSVLPIETHFVDNILNEPGLIFFFTQFNGFTHFYQIRMLLIIYLHTVKWFQVLLQIANNSVKHQSFIYSHLNVKTVLFQTIQFRMSNSYIWHIDRTLSSAIIPGRVDQGAMAMKRYSAFPKALASLEPRYQIVKCHIKDTHSHMYIYIYIYIGNTVYSWTSFFLSLSLSVYIYIYMKNSHRGREILITIYSN